MARGPVNRPVSAGAKGSGASARRAVPQPYIGPGVAPPRHRRPDRCPHQPTKDHRELDAPRAVAGGSRRGRGADPAVQLAPRGGGRRPPPYPPDPGRDVQLQQQLAVRRHLPEWRPEPALPHPRLQARHPAAHRGSTLVGRLELPQLGETVDLPEVVLHHGAARGAGVPRLRRCDDQRDRLPEWVPDGRSRRGLPPFQGRADPGPAAGPQRSRRWSSTGGCWTCLRSVARARPSRSTT